MVLAHGRRVEYAPRAESGPIFNFYMGNNTPACVAAANSKNERTEPSHLKAQPTVQITPARRRPERKDYIMDKLILPVEE